MARLLERYQRTSDGKQFAVVAVGSFTEPEDLSATKDRVTLEAEDGERIESRSSSLRGAGPFARIED